LHELSICQSILRIVDATLEEHPGATLKKIFLEIGKGSTIEPVLLCDAFEIVTFDGPYEGTELVIDEIPLVGRCRSCDRAFGYEEIALGCPSCGSRSIAIESGLELNIKELEIDEGTSA
jgi:hydrogenase nickel incorporation protein HypA/HybF